MRRISVSTPKHGKNSPAVNSYQSSRSRYLRAFASARAMRFWRPRVAVKELTMAAAFAAAIAMGPSTAHAQFPASFDLSTLDGTNGFVLTGRDSNDRSGSSVSGAGDVNGDGIDDLIIGAPDINGGVISDGVSYVVFGRNSGFSASLGLEALDGTNGFVINGINVGDYNGSSVSGAGDLNGDGFDDLIIGANGADANGNSRAGESYVVFGGSGGFSPSLDLSALDRASGVLINGIDAGDRSGYSVSNAGDVNGDGIDDVIIGAIGGEQNGNNYAGESYVVFGNNSGFSSTLNLSALDGSNGFVINGIDVADESGGSVSNAGDVNGDGIDDLIIGAFGADPNGNTSSGESYVVFGSNSGFSSSIDLNMLDGSNGFVIIGIDRFDRSGRSVSGAGDVNGDGIDDLIIGATGGTTNGNNFSGESYVVFGNNSGFSSSLDLNTLNGTNGFVINGIDPNEGSGQSVSGAGDVNGDGIDDLVIGNLGVFESYVVFGNNLGFSSSLDLSTLNGTNGFVINRPIILEPGVPNSSYNGGSVSGAGDVNGDGIDDVTSQISQHSLQCCNRAYSKPKRIVIATQLSNSQIFPCLSTSCKTIK